MKKDTKKGFTLIELLVVIAIIGILSSVVVASMNTARRKSRDARRVSDIASIRTALELYADANSSSYPATTGAIAALTSGGYMSATPADPLGGTNIYFYLGCGTSYILGADLEDSANSALTSDNDTLPAGSPGNVGTCTAIASPFTALADTAGCAGATGRYCYSVRP